MTWRFAVRFSITLGKVERSEPGEERIEFSGSRTDLAYQPRYVGFEAVEDA